MPDPTRRRHEPAGQASALPEAIPVTHRFNPLTAAQAARFFDADTAGYVEDFPVLHSYARRTGGALLELGCGTGRLLVPLAQAGYQVTGVDLSPAMLDIARAKTAAAGMRNRVTLIEGDYTGVSLPGTYRFAFIVMNTFMHLLTQDEQLSALRHWHAHLAPGGLLLIDVFQPDVVELAGLENRIELDKSWIDPASGATVVKQVVRSVEQAEQIMHVLMMYDEIAADGLVRRTLVPFDLRYLWRFEAELLLEKAGYIVEDVYGDWEMGPLESGSERLILVARRP